MVTTTVVGVLWDVSMIVETTTSVVGIVVGTVVASVIVSVAA